MSASGRRCDSLTQLTGTRALGKLLSDQQKWLSEPQVSDWQWLCCRDPYQVVTTAFLCLMQDGLPLPEFLGPYVPPQNLTLDSLRSVADKKHGDFAAVISAATIRLKAATGTGGSSQP